MIAVLGWLVAGGFLVVGVPPFLRMPLWADATLYDVAARNVLSGGVHYRDVFDTNPPGFVWAVCVVRRALGPSAEALRFVDLGIVVLVFGCLLVWARRAGASHAGLAWAAAAAAAFYPLSPEFNHVQRDVWMMLPAVLAVALRLQRITGKARPLPVGSAVLEGLCWGGGCWLKPHLLPVAAAVWLATVPRLGPRMAVLRDLLLVTTGAGAALLGGVVWLVATGAWPHFLDVWMNWNNAYAAVVARELPFRLTIQFGYFPPYSACVLLAAPLAAVNLRDRHGDDPARFRRAVLAAAYLAWLGTALVLQRGFHYAHIPETLLMLAVFAANRWPVPAALVLVQVLAGLLTLVAEYSPGLAHAHRQARCQSVVYRYLTERNPAFDPDRLKLWPACFDRDPPRELRRGLALWRPHFGSHDPVELGAVADFLRTQSVGDGELIAWHDTPHALYLELGLRPGLRFLHVGTAWNLGPWQRERVREELRASARHARFAVSDLYRVTARRGELTAAGADGLPLVLPDPQRRVFPFDQPVVFRSPAGRYLVHRLVSPVEDCDIPEQLDRGPPAGRWGVIAGEGE